MSQDHPSNPTMHENCASNGHIGVHLFVFYCAHQRRWDGWLHFTEEEGGELRSESIHMDFSPFWTEEEVVEAVQRRVKHLMDRARRTALEQQLLDGSLNAGHDEIALRLFDL